MPVNIVNNTDAIKRQDNITPIEVLLTDDNNANYPIDGKTVKAWFSNETGFLYEKELTERDGQKLIIRIDPDEVNKIGIGKIKMEIVVEESDRQKIFPNGSYIEFEIVRNLKSINGTVLNPITLEFFEQEFDDLKLVADAATQRANDAADRVEALEPTIAELDSIADRAETAATNAETAAKESTENSVSSLNKIGDINQLPTLDKENLTKAITELFKKSGGQVSVMQFEHLKVETNQGTDWYLAIQAAVDYAVKNKLRLTFPPGIFRVSKPIIVNKNTDPGTNFVTDFTMSGEFGVPLYNDYVMPTQIVAMDVFPDNEPVFDLRYTKKTAVRCLGIKGKVTSTGIEYGERTANGREFKQHYIELCSIFNCYYGIRSSNAGLMKINLNSVSGCKYVGIALLQYSGDSDLSGNNVNTNNTDYIGTDAYAGSGILVAQGSNNVNIRGGKNEWNAKGITVYGSNGVTIGLINFDWNKWTHVYVRSTDAAQFSSGSISITGNRFLSGGVTDNGQYATKAHVVLDAPSNSTISGTITGNTFRKGGSNAYDLNTRDTVGPLLTGIKAQGPGKIRMAVSGNDMEDCAVSSTVLLSGSNIIFRMYGNLINLPLEKYNGAKVFKDNDRQFGSYTLNGDGTTNTVNIPHGLGVFPAMCIVQERSIAAGNARIRRISWDVTNIIVYFDNALESGTNNVILSWVAEV